MYFFAMDLGWKRVPILLILLTFWKHAVGHKGWSSQDVQPQWKGPVHKVLSPRGARSSVLEAPVTGSIPFEEVASNVFGKSLNANRSRFSLSHQYVKGGVSSSYESTSHTQSAPSVSASMVLPQNQHRSDSLTSLLQLQGSFSPSVQDITSQTGHQLGETSSPLSALSNSSTDSSASSLSKFTYTSQGSSRPQKADSSSQLVSTHGVSGLLLQSPSSSTPSQNIPGSSAYTKLSASPLGVSQSTSGQSLYSQYTLGSHSRAGTQLAASSQHVPTSFQPEVTTSQYAPKFSLGTKVPVSRQYNPATQSGSSLFQSQSSQMWQPSTSRTKGLQASSTAVSQGFQTSGASQSISQSPSRLFSLSSASTDGSSLQLQGTSSQYAPAALDAKVPVYSQAAPSGSSLSLSQPSQLKPSTSRWSQGFQASGTVASQGFQTSGTATSQSSSLSQGSKAPSRLSTLTSAASPGQFSSTQEGSGRYSGLSSQSQSASSQYIPGSPAYAKYGSSFIDASSQATSDQSSLNLYASSSQSRAGTHLAGSSPYLPTQTGSTFTDGSPLQLQGTSSQYAPAALNAKVPVYSQAAPSGSSLSLSQPSQLKPSTSRWSQGFQASGTVASQGFQTSGTATSQSSSLSQGSKAPSRSSTLTSAASPGQFASTQQGSGRYSGLSSQSQSASSQYRPGSPAYAKHGSSLLDGSSQSTSDQSASDLYASSSQSRTGTQLAGPSRYVPTQTGSTFTDGSSLQLQGTSSQYAPALAAKVPVSSQAAPSGFSSSLSWPSHLKPSSWSQGFQASGTMTSQSSSLSQGSKAPSRFSTLTSSPSQFASTQDGSGRYRPGFPAYAKHGSSLLDGSSQSTSDQSASDLYASSSQSRTGTQLAGPSRYVPTQTGSTFTDGSSLQLQGTSSQYAPALAAKVPVSSQAAPSGYSMSQPSQWQPSTSRLSQGFQASGTVASQSSSLSQGSKAPSRFSTLTSAASPGQFASTQQGSGRYSGLSSQSQSASSQYRPGSPAYAKHGSSLLDGSSQSTSDQSASDLYASSSQSRTGTQLAGPSRYVPTQTGSTFTDGSSLQLQGTSSLYSPAAVAAKVPVYSRVTPSGSLLSQLQPSASSWSQGFQASGTAVSQSSSSPQTPQFSSGSSIMPALSPPVDSVAQSSQSSISNSWRTPSLSGVGLQPSMPSSQTASGSVIRRQMSPGLFASVQHPPDSVTSSLGSNVQAASQGMFSGQSSDSTSVLSSRYASYGQKPSGYSRLSQSSSASGRYLSSVKG
ncbi:platelet binding protein GspB [Ctenopharyngodon idella]|uniref:platelet binding protein GspB n=1 Tax=Ctenopharyngodon idella TaxID=7959 RepID=UPI002231D2CC|nr:platelet binding protein GspB [Ctenopharyngodon idella]